MTDKCDLHKMGSFLLRKERLEGINLCRVQANDITGDLQNTVTHDCAEDVLHVETRILASHKLDSRLLGYCIVLTGKELQTFRKSTIPPPTFRVKQSEKKMLFRLLDS